MRLHAFSAILLGLSVGAAVPRPATAQQQPQAGSPDANQKNTKDAISSSVSQLVDQLRRHPAEPSKAAGRVPAGLYMIEINTGEVTLIAGEPHTGITYCGSPAWSNDGKRIVFDANRPGDVQHAHIKTIEVAGGELKMTDLGIGNCPTFSPDGDEIAFFLNPGAVPDFESGIWLMKTDGTHHTPVGSSGRPKSAPDGRRFMVGDFEIPTTVTFMDKSGENLTPLQIPGMKIHTSPAWVSDNTIIAVVGAVSGDDIALIDVTDPAQAKVKEILLKTNFRGGALDVRPTYPVYLPETGRCIFVGIRNGKALYSFERGKADKLNRLEPEGSDRLMRDLALSPDGRYALFTSNRTGPRQRGGAPVNGPAKLKQ